MMKHFLLTTLLAQATLAAPAARSVLPQDAKKYINTSKLNYTAQLGYILRQYYDGILHSYEAPDSYWVSEDYLSSDIKGIFGALDNQTAVQDRTCTKYGLNLYDGATATIAMTLKGAADMAEMYEKNILYTSSTCMAEYGEKCAENFPDINGLENTRADTEDYLYGKDKIPGSSLRTVLQPGGPDLKGDDVFRPGAFFFRMISPRYLTSDPLLGPYATSFKAPYPDKDGPEWDTFGAIHWNDWKPITGENAWAGLIGPLQTLYMRENGTIPMWKSLKEAPHAIQLAVSVMPAFEALLSEEGSLYHCPEGTKMFPPDKKDEATNVSNENNFSSYAGMKMLLFLLKNNTIGTDADITAAMTAAQKIITSLEGFFKKSMSPVLKEGKNLRVFYQGGHVPFEGGFEPVELYVDPQAFAVDCQTWAVGALGQEFIDTAFGDGTAYRMWQATKLIAGYYDEKGVLGGVGYTNHTIGVNRPHDVWSAEWTFGAIMMVRELSVAYAKSHPDWAADLTKDMNLMETALTKPFSKGGMINDDNDGYMYANQRFFIPWGWYANAISSLCSTSWAVMNEVKFNPFVLGGGVF